MDEPDLCDFHTRLATEAAAQQVVAGAEEPPAAPSLLFVLHRNVDFVKIGVVNLQSTCCSPECMAMIRGLPLVLLD